MVYADDLSLYNYYNIYNSPHRYCCLPAVIKGEPVQHVVITDSYMRLR